MTLFQLLLLLGSAIIFYILFKQLFSGSYPKRGIDFEAKLPDEQIGGVSRADKIFSRSNQQKDRIEELNEVADRSVQDGNWQEASKALGSALIIDPDNTETLYKMAFVEFESDQLESAKERLQKLIESEPNNDMAHALLANILHKLDNNDEALSHHKRSIEIDDSYANHYFNYANTLYDMGRNDEALNAYRRAYELDNSLDDAKEMIKKLSER